MFLNLNLNLSPSWTYTPDLGLKFREQLKSMCTTAAYVHVRLLVSLVVLIGLKSKTPGTNLVHVVMIKATSNESIAKASPFV